MVVTMAGNLHGGESSHAPSSTRPSHAHPPTSTPERDGSTRISAQTIAPGVSQPNRASSRTRDRGYSLRRSLFAQGIQRQNEERGMVIEMERPSTQRQDIQTTKGPKDPTVTFVEEAICYGSSATELRGTDAKFSSHGWPSSMPTAEPQLWREIRSKVQEIQSFFDRKMGPVQLPKSADGRHVQVNVHDNAEPIDERTGKPYIVNRIRSCKYTLWNFLPKQLVAQFGKLANFYFLVISILQMIPGLSTTGTFTTIVPLLIFVSVSMAKEGYEDVCRNRLDKEDNESLVLVLNSSAKENEPKSDEPIRKDSTQWSKRKWQDLKVGDVVLLERDDAVPADLVLLKASGAEGIAHIETKSLDGETNLKSKKPLDVVAKRCTNEFSIACLEADFVVEDPNLDLYKFDGRLSLAGETVPLTSNEVVYRGSIIRNTQHTVGIVVYSGEECKIRMNANKNPRVKAPTLQAKVNRVVVIVAGLVFFIAAILTVGYAIWKPRVESNSWYLIDANVPMGHVFTAFVIML